MNASKIHVFAPATVANVACGFDILGFALDMPGDEVIMQKTARSGVNILRITGDGGRLPLDAAKNTAGVAVLSFLKYINAKEGVELELYKHLPLGSGLGSSSASAVAAVYAANQLFGAPLKTEELLPFTMDAEKVACGSAHADNVAPCLMGGIVLIRSYQPLDVIRIHVPEKLYCAVVTPSLEVRTEDARRILRKEISFKDAVMQWGNIAGLIAGFQQSDYALIGRSLKDVIVEPVRSLLIPGFDELKEKVIQAGALGCSISGSGPSVFALFDTKQKADESAVIMKEVFGGHGIDSITYVSTINKEGPRVIKANETVISH